MVEGLVREFVPRALVAGLDFSGLQRINPKFHCGRRSARRRECDVIWRLPTCEGSDIYLYLLIEFQSESDAWMAGRGVKLSGSKNLSEMKTMLATQFEAWREQWLAEGEAKGKTMIATQFEAWKDQWVAEGEAKGLVRGKVEGRVEGRVEGKAEALVCLLAQRFGAVAPSWQKRIRGAKLATLERWFKRAIVAPDLPSVFNPPR
jgi:predicted transposase YdaD